jgi:tetratricopeptide (TPR) repeat protein
MLRWKNDLTSYQVRSVTATFEALFVELDRDSFDVARFLTLLSFLDPERIQLRMLVDGAERLSQLGRLPTATSSQSTAPLSRNVITRIRNRLLFSRNCGKLSVAEIKCDAPLSSDFRSLLTLILSPIRLMEAILKLQRLSLVRRVSSDDQSALRIHDLVQFMVTERAKKVDTYREFLRSAVSLVCRAFERVENPDLPEWWPEFESFMPHLHSLDERWSGGLGVSLDLAKADVDIARYLMNRGRYGEAEVTCKRSVERFEKECGGNHHGTLHAAHVLAMVHYRQGRYGDAETAFERIIEGWKKTLSADDKSTLWSMNCLALVYEEQRPFSETEELLRPALAGLEKNLGSHHFYTLAVMGNTARVYRHQERYVDAEHLFKRTLAGKEKNMGPDHLGTLIVHNLASVYELQNRYVEAEELYTRALRIKYHTTIARLLYDYCTTMYDHCTTTARLLPDCCPTAARLLPDYCPTVARLLHDYCMTTHDYV